MFIILIVCLLISETTFNENLYPFVQGVFPMASALLLSYTTRYEIKYEAFIYWMYINTIYMNIIR